MNHDLPGVDTCGQLASGSFTEYSSSPFGGQNQYRISVFKRQKTLQKSREFHGYSARKCSVTATEKSAVVNLDIA